MCYHFSKIVNKVLAYNLRTAVFFFSHYMSMCYMHFYSFIKVNYIYIYIYIYMHFHRFFAIGGQQHLRY